MPGVREVAVVGVADPDWGQQVVALYSVRAGADVTPEAVIEHCRCAHGLVQEAEGRAPRSAFPLNSTGKIAKRVLRDRLESGLAADEERV